MSVSTGDAQGSLASLQQWMLDALVHPQRVDPSDVDRHLRASRGMDAGARLAIYQRSYILRLAKCMAEQFPALCHALGDSLFADFAREYVQAQPSEAYTLYDLGRRFPAYLEESRPDRELPEGEREDWIDFMVDLARYERELFRLFDAPGHEGQPWPTAAVPDDRLVLQPCFALGEYRYPVAWYYHEVRQEKNPQFPPRRPSFVAIARRDYVTSTFPIHAVHHRFLCAMQAGRSVGESLSVVSEALQRRVEDVRRSWATEVRTAWIEAGFFVCRPDSKFVSEFVEEGHGANGEPGVP